MIGSEVNLCYFERLPLDWDAANDNGVTSKSSHHKEWLEIRAVLSDDVGLAKQSDDR
jgi:hypothetical protein